MTLKGLVCSKHCAHPQMDREQEHPGICQCGGYLTDEVLPSPWQQIETYSSRQIVMDRFGPGSEITGPSGPRRLGHNPSWMRVVDVARAILATRLQHAAEMQERWQPIVTAPKDRRILLVCPFENDTDWICQIGEWDNLFGCFRYDADPHEIPKYSIAHLASHWMPLPVFIKSGVNK